MSQLLSSPAIHIDDLNLDLDALFGGFGEDSLSPGIPDVRSPLLLTASEVVIKPPRSPRSLVSLMGASSSTTDSPPEYDMAPLQKISKRGPASWPCIAYPPMTEEDLHAPLRFPSDDPCALLGKYNASERVERLARWRRKRVTLKPIQLYKASYTQRQAIALMKPRCSGRFVKMEGNKSRKRRKGS